MSKLPKEREEGCASMEDRRELLLSDSIFYGIVLLVKEWFISKLQSTAQNFRKVQCRILRPWYKYYESL